MFRGSDPRDDSRDRDDGIRDREEDWLRLGRSPDSAAVRSADDGEDAPHRNEDRREERDREPRDRDKERGGSDPRDVFMRDLDLPRGVERELVHDRDRDYALRGSDTRTLSTVGAFRVVAERDLRHGQKTHDFLQKLVERGYARPIQVGPLHRGRLFHVGYKPLYAAIGETDNRHRKPASLGRLVGRLMVLDAVLADRAFRTVRYFPDKLPIGVQRDRTDHVFLYLVTSPVPMDFRLFLLRHAELLRPLYRWTIRVLVPQPFTKAIPGFGHAAHEELATPIHPSAAEELAWYFRERRRRSEPRCSMDDERFRRATAAFRAPRFRVLFRLWQHDGDPVIWAAQSGTLKDALARQEGRVEFVQLPHQYLHLSSLVGVA